MRDRCSGSISRNYDHDQLDDTFHSRDKGNAICNSLETSDDLTPPLKQPQTKRRTTNSNFQISSVFSNNEESIINNICVISTTVAKSKLCLSNLLSAETSESDLCM